MRLGGVDVTMGQVIPTRYQVGPGSWRVALTCRWTRPSKNWVNIIYSGRRAPRSFCGRRYSKCRALCRALVELRVELW
jgi:hypothetical protein